MQSRFIVPKFIFLFTAITIHISYAADSLTHTYPSVVLVELKSEQSRLHALIKDRKYKELEEVKNDISAVSATMIRDFTDNFNYCPVYYFYDTNMSFVLKKQFEGVLLDANQVAAHDLKINAESKNYVIVYIGYPAEQSHAQRVVKDSAKYISNSGEPMGKGLIINNDKMQQINYLYSLGYDSRPLNKKVRKYAYSSKHFNIQYLPTAREFNMKLKHRKRKNKQNMKLPRQMS